MFDRINNKRGASFRNSMKAEHGSTRNDASAALCSLLQATLTLQFEVESTKRNKILSFNCSTTRYI